MRPNVQTCFSLLLSGSLLWRTDQSPTSGGRMQLRDANIDVGANVYFVPFPSGNFVRFRAKSPASMPAGYSGSFF